MKKIIAVVAILVACGVCLTGCNKSFIDTTYHFDTAIIALADGTSITGKVQSWTDYEEGDQIQVKMNDKVYLVHSSDITLIAE